MPTRNNTVLPAIIGLSGKQAGSEIAKINAVILAAGEAGCTAAEVVEACGASEALVRAHFNTLHSQGHLVRLKRGRYGLAKSAENGDDFNAPEAGEYDTNSQLVERWEQVEANIRTLETARRSQNAELWKEYESLIKNGTCFVAYPSEVGVAFAPSKFIGYVDNDFDTHLKVRGRGRHGGNTNRAIGEILGRAAELDASAEESYRDFCRELGFEPNENGTGGHPRKYWLTDKNMGLDDGNANFAASTRGRGRILGYSATSVFKWMGAHGFTNEQAKRVYDLLMEGDVKWEGSATQALADGRNPRYRNREPLNLSKDEERKLRAVANGEGFGTEAAASAEEADIDAVLTDPELTQTEKKQLVSARLGQGRFRRGLIGLRGGYCCLTGCDAVDLLRASHIKPWRDSDNRERLDKFNGLLLTPNSDALFDQVYISFTDGGEMLVSKKLDKDARRLLLSGCGNSIEVFPENRPYLSFHRRLFEIKESEK